MNKKELIRLFKKIGAPNPEEWAESQIEEGIPQLHRYAFLKQAWKRILRDEDQEWIDDEIKNSERDEEGPYADIGITLKSMVGKGVSKQEITKLVRAVQAQSLFHFCYLLDEPGEMDAGIEDLAWGLFEIDGEGNPVQQIDGLHESVLETDPTGREMRPRKNENNP